MQPEQQRLRQRLAAACGSDVDCCCFFLRSFFLTVRHDRSCPCCSGNATTYYCHRRRSTFSSNYLVAGVERTPLPPTAAPLHGRRSFVKRLSALIESRGMSCRRRDGTASESVQLRRQKSRTASAIKCARGNLCFAKAPPPPAAHLASLPLAQVVQAHEVLAVWGSALHRRREEVCAGRARRHGSVQATSHKATREHNHLAGSARSLFAWSQSSHLLNRSSETRPQFPDSSRSTLLSAYHLPPQARARSSAGALGRIPPAGGARGGPAAHLTESRTKSLSSFSGRSGFSLLAMSVKRSAQAAGSATAICGEREARRGVSRRRPESAALLGSLPPSAGSPFGDSFVVVLAPPRRRRAAAALSARALYPSDVAFRNARIFSAFGPAPGEQELDFAVTSRCPARSRRKATRPG